MSSASIQRIVCCFFFFNFTHGRLKRTYVNNFAMQINPASGRVIVEELEPNDLGLVVGALQLI